MLKKSDIKLYEHIIVDDINDVFFKSLNRNTIANELLLMNSIKQVIQRRLRELYEKSNNKLQ